MLGKLGITSDAFSAWQWEAAGADASDGTVWPTRVLGYAAFARELWSAECPAAERRHLLSRRQSAALWRSVIEESAEADELLGIGGIADWAEDAWRRILGARLESALPAPAVDEPDYAAFLRWRRGYTQRLRDARWIDEAQLDGLLAESAETLPPRHIELLDLDETEAARAHLFERLARAGWHIARCRAPSATSRRLWQLGCRDTHDELERAAAWALAHCRRDGDARVAIVVPDLGARAGTVRRRLADVMEATWAPREPTPRVYVASERSDRAQPPLLGAALQALGWLAPGGTVTDFAKWLRSPFFSGDDPAELGARARLELTLRRGVSGLAFREAYLRTGLRERCRDDLPEVAARIDAALFVLDEGLTRTPAAWVNVWERALEALGWTGTAGDVAESQPPTTHLESQQHHWESALRDVASLTPILGGIPPRRALTELEVSVRGTRPREAIPLAGVHVLADIGDIGPGLAAAWISGAIDTALPRPERLNALLPRRLQVDREMPWSTPQDALRRSRELLDEATRRVAACVVSWAGVDGDQSNAPSPLLRSLTMADPADEEFAAREPREGRLLWEVIPKDVPLPLAAVAIRGGTAALSAQAVCPLHAYLHFRLGAEAMEPFERGLPPRLQGIVSHAALERFFRAFGSREALAGRTAEQRDEQALRCADAALADVFGRVRVALPALFSLERDRLAQVLGRLVDRELERADYRVASLERSVTLDLRGTTLSTRVDRVDVLHDGTLAIIDYKTGRRPPPLTWSNARPRDLQLPTYALTVTGLAALAVATVRSSGARYDGIWPAGAFPGRTLRLDGNTASLESLLEHWRHRIAALVQEFCSGDTRMFPGQLDPADGAFAPLSRLHEQLALHRSRLARGVSRDGG